MGKLPLKRGNRDLFDGRTELANRHGIVQRQRLANLLILRTMPVLRPLVETRYESSIDALGGNFFLNGLSKTLNQADHQDNQRDSDHHPQNGEEATELMRSNSIKRQLKVFFEILLHDIPSFRPVVLRSDLAARRAWRDKFRKTVPKPRPPLRSHPTQREGKTPQEIAKQCGAAALPAIS